MSQGNFTQNVSTITQRWLQNVPAFFIQPAQIFRTYDRSNLRGDLIASLTVAVVLLPQAIAYALIADLPPQVGLYAAVVATIVGALWGSSFHLHTGPTNTTSLLVLAGLSAVAASGTEEYLLAAGVMAFWAGIIRLLMGIARLGILVNFVSDSVVVGFTAGAGMLIVENQVRHLFRLQFSGSPYFFTTLASIGQHINEFHLPSFVVGLMVITILIVLSRLRPKWPRALIAMFAASAYVALLRQYGLAYGVITLGEIPRSLPPLQSIPIFDLTLIRTMAPGILAVALIGLIEAASISRAVASRSGQYLDSDQEFVGQGLANVAVSFFSGYPVAGSLTRSLVNFEAGARSQMAAILSAVWVLAAMLLFAPAAAFLPRAALAGILVVTGTKMINVPEIKRIWRTSSGDAMIMIVTWGATLLLPLEFAVLTGILISFARYISKTSAPGVYSVLPDDEFAHFEYQPDKEECPQLGVITIMGSLYFGAARYVEDQIRAHMNRYPEQRYLLLRMHRVNHCDISGIHMLETIVKLYRQRGGDIFMVGLREAVWEKINLSDFDILLGVDHFLEQESAIIHIFNNVLNPAICVYHCPVRAWKECQSLPKSNLKEPLPAAMLIPPAIDTPEITPNEFWERLNDSELELPLIVDVREREEFDEGHLRVAKLIPMPELLERYAEYIPRDKEVIFVCRSGRRSAQVVNALQQHGYDQVTSLAGGMIALELANLSRTPT